MALHVSGEAPEEQLSTDFSNLNKFNDEVRIVISVSNVSNYSVLGYFIYIIICRCLFRIR